MCTSGSRARATSTTSMWNCAASDETVVDAYSLPVGIRTVAGRRDAVPDQRRAVLLHAASASTRTRRSRGKGHDDAFMVHDFALLDWLGANSFRTSHYPYAEEVLEYADRHGIVVIDETAAVGLNIGLAGGIFGARGLDDLLRGDDQRRHAGGPPPGDPRADRARQEPSLRRDLEHRQRAGVRHARGARLLRAAGRRGPPARPDAPRRLRQLHARHRPTMT